MMLVWALAISVIVAVRCDDLILKPKTTSSGAKAIALLFAPGFGIGPSAYEPLLTTLQTLVEQDGSKALWVGCPQMNGNITTVGLEGALKKLSAKMTEAGLPADHGTLYSGHSVGGALLPYIVRKPDNMADGFNSPEGMMLLASFLVREFRTEAIPEKGPGQYEFPTAVLTIGGELDGLSRVTRMAEAFYTQITANSNPDAAKKNLPVTVIEGVSHMQFASGQIPSNVMKKDLIPEVSYEEAHSKIASDMVAFISGIYDAEWDALSKRVEETKSFVAPIVDALLLEGYHQFKPPCYCEEPDEYGGLEYGTCPQMPGCTASSPWTQIGQQIIAGEPDSNGKGLKVSAKDSQHIVTEEDPSCHLPHIHGGEESGKITANSVPSANPGNGDSDPLCSSPEDCTLDVTTITQLVYEIGSEFDFWRIDTGNDNIDTGYYPISAQEMKSKMKSRQSLWQAANNTKAVSGEASFDDLDSPEQGLCASINAASIDWASHNAAAKTKNRYDKYGQAMVASPEQGDKKVCIAGPCWIWADLEYQGKRKGEEQIDVVAPTFAFENKNPYPCDEKTPDKKHVLPCTAGMHYCKLVSPARVVEWMYVDGLRLHYSLASQAKAAKKLSSSAVSMFGKKDEPKCCETCPDGTDKYYSIPKHHQESCGESCIAPDDVATYSKLEPGMQKAETNTPCVDHGYSIYDHTETHGKHTPVAISVDFYKKSD